MKLTQIALLTACALLMAACNRPSSDQGGIGPSAASGTSQENGAPVAPPKSDLNSARTPSGTAGDAKDVARPADNTGKNVRDRSDATVTPGDQSESKSDLDLTRSIRRAITENSQFSTSAKNIKVITVNGKVTLRGPVNTASEKEQIAKLAQGTAGVTAIDDQLEVKNNQ